MTTLRLVPRHPEQVTPMLTLDDLHVEVSRLEHGHWCPLHAKPGRVHAELVLLRDGGVRCDVGYVVVDDCDAVEDVEG